MYWTKNKEKQLEWVLVEENVEERSFWFDRIHHKWYVADFLEYYSSNFTPNKKSV